MVGSCCFRSNEVHNFHCPLTSTLDTPGADKVVEAILALPKEAFDVDVSSTLPVASSYTTLPIGTPIIHCAFAFQTPFDGSIVWQLLKAGASLREVGGNLNNCLHVCAMYDDGKGAQFIMELCQHDAVLKRELLDQSTHIAL